MMTSGSTPNRKAVSSLALIVTWDLWSRCNAQVFHNKHAPPLGVLDKIRSEVHLWATAGAKRLGEVMPEE
jgi:hypothetical protein